MLVVWAEAQYGPDRGDFGRSGLTESEPMELENTFLVGYHIGTRCHSASSSLKGNLGLFWLATPVSVLLSVVGLVLVESVLRDRC